MARQLRLLLMLLCFALLVCGVSANASDTVTFCLSNGRPDDRVVFDLAQERVSGADNSASLRIVSAGAYIGIVDPIPLMIPSEQVLRKGGPFVWTAGSYRFHANSSRADPKWLFVSADPVKSLVQPEARKRVTMLYSSETGVIAWQEVSQIQGKRFSADYYLCGEGKLRLTGLLNSANRTRQYQTPLHESLHRK